MHNKISYYSNSTIYVLSPAYFKTGGTELLHQYVSVLKNAGFNCEIAYTDATTEKNINPAFKSYVSSYLDIKNIIDEQTNILIVPETFTYYLKKFKKIRTIIWWESVDLYLYNTSIGYNIRKFLDAPKTSLHFLKNIFLNKGRGLPIRTLRKVDYHFAQSYYASAFLSKNGIKDNVFYVSDYINDIYLDYDCKYIKVQKQDYVCFNPLKGKRATHKIVKHCKNIRFVPLINMTNQQVFNTLSNAKVYMDFGYHPGKDRFPREAASLCCCVITNKKGSANYYYDVKTPEKYKFRKVFGNINNIQKTIQKCIDNYNECIDDFSEYRLMIKGEKNNFYSDVVNCYQLINK